MAGILQWNIRGAYSNFEDLCLLNKQFGPRIVALQECLISNKKSFSLKGFTVFSRFNDSPQGGVALLVDSFLLSSQLELDTNLQAVAVQVSCGKTFTVCSLYLPPSQSVSKSDLEDLFSQLPAPFLILGDFNAHSSLWGDKCCDTRGKILESLVSELDLVILNSGCPTYVQSSSGSMSAIDLSICSPSLTLDFEWSVVSDLYGSDHYPIHLANTSSFEEDVEHFWDFNKANWSLFQSLCETRISEVLVSDSDPVASFSDVLIEIARTCIPKKAVSLKSSPRVPWFSSECREAIRARKTAHRKFVRHPTEENWINFKKLKAKAKFVCKTQKKKSWQNFCSNLDSNTSPAKVWKAIRKISGKKKSSGLKHLKVNGKLISDRRSIANVLASSIARHSSSSNLSPTFSKLKATREKVPLAFGSAEEEAYNVPFSIMELKQALLKSNSSAAGPDDIHYNLLTHLPDSSLDILLQVYNSVWKSGFFPPSWAEATVVAVPKAGKDHSDPVNYRPIALTSCLCKTMERMVNSRLMWELESRGLLASVQCGFRKNRSTVDHLVRLESFIREAFARKQQVIAVFFDLEKAYDTTWKYGILKDLFDLNFRGNLPSFIEGFLSNRLFRVKVGSTLSESFTQELGVPQGSILSPVLFSLKLNNIIKSVLKDCEASLFVDDFSLCIRGRYLPHIERSMQLCVNKVQRWVDENGFKFSYSKTVCVHFRKSTRQVAQPSISLGRQCIKVVPEVKFLGIIFDQHLSFLPHIRYLKVKCLNALNILRVVGHTDWGADKVTLLRLYRSLVRSRLDYGCTVYSSAKPYILKLLDSVHHEGLRIALGAFRTSPMTSLYAEAGEPPLRLRRIQLSLNYYLKLRAFPENPAYDCVFNPPPFMFHANVVPSFGVRMFHHVQKANLPIENIDDITAPSWVPWFLKAPVIDFSLSRFQKEVTNDLVFKSTFLECRDKYPDFHEIYTDGSKYDSKVSAAAVDFEGGATIRLKDNSSIFSAELEAILLALDRIKSFGNVRKDFLIISDSLSALLSLANVNYSHPVCINIFDALSDLSPNICVVFIWVPSHVGIRGNEVADAVAKLGLDAVCSSKLSVFSDFKPLIKSYIKSLWQSEWDNEVNNKLYQSLPCLSDNLLSRTWSRRQESVLTRLHIGHCYFSHSFLLRRENPPFCQVCQVPYTVKHVLLDCRVLAGSRGKFFHVQNLYTLFRTVDPLAIFRFLHETNLFSRI